MEEVAKLVASVAEQEFGQKLEVELTRPDYKFGDFASNVALQLSKKVGKNPREIAEQIVGALSQDDDISSAEVAGPGFINIKLSDKKIMQLAKADAEKSLAGKTVVAEYSDPNPFKVLHAGHLYTSVVGDAIANLLEEAGAKVHRVNFGGDVGLHVGKTMWAILKKLGGENPDKLMSIADHVEWLTDAYVEGTAAYEDDEKAKQEIIALNKKVYELHKSGDKDSDFAKIYWMCRDWSYRYFETFYQLIGVEFEKYYPESEVADLGIQTVKEGLEKGVFEKSDGAVVFRGEEHGLHTRVFLNSEGLPTYEAKDLGLALCKWQDFKYDQSFIITGNDIVEYMKVVQAALGILKPEIPQSAHITHGQVKMPGGVKMSSRKGNILRATDILDAASQAASKLSEQKDDSVSLAAVKYAFVKVRTGGDIIYDPEESVSLQGNSGPYLQYAHARACSVLEKSDNQPKVPENLEEGERELANKLGEYTEVVEKSISELMPHHLCTYLYELAQTFNRFYEKNRVIGDEREAERLELVSIYKNTLSVGLEILGIVAPEQM